MRGWVGVGYRKEIAHWIDTVPSEISCLEITAEHFFGGNLEKSKQLAQHYSTFVHGLSLSLGTPGPIDDKKLEAFHAENIQADLWRLINAVVEYAPVQAIIIERDQNFPSVEELKGELNTLRGLLESRYATK